MADNPDNPEQSTPTKVTVNDIGIAPFFRGRFEHRIY